MKLLSYVTVLTGPCFITGLAFAASSGAPFYGDPPDEHHPWAVHDQNRPQPPVVKPGTFSTQDQPGRPPSDAVVLFDGTGLEKWRATRDGNGPAQWVVKDGLLQVKPGAGDIVTSDQFGDCQLHVEWSEPTDVQGSSQGRGNSGIFLMGICEVQVLDNYQNITYADGYAGSVYGVNPPMVNPLRPPGEFQVYDIVFRRPIYKDGKELDPGYLTVFINGVLVQDHTRLEGPTGHMGRTHPQAFPEKGSLKLQDHGNPVRFRNIWYRPLPPRAVEGGTDGYLTTEATLAKRKQIAAQIRQDATQLRNETNPMPELLRLLESLEYEKDAGTVKQVDELATKYITTLKSLPADQLNARKDEVKRLAGAYQYLVRFKVLPEDYAPRREIDEIIKERGWDKK